MIYHLENMWTETAVTYIKSICYNCCGCTEERHNKLNSCFADRDSTQAIPDYEGGERHCLQIPTWLNIAAITHKLERELFYLTVLSVGNIG
jgi:hypothetical protein